MLTENEIRIRLREWVAAKSGKVSASALQDDTPILEQRLITSLQVMDLILFVESLSGSPIQVDKLKPGVFHDVDAIYRNFFAVNGVPHG